MIFCPINYLYYSAQNSQKVVQALIEEAEEYSHDIERTIETFHRALNICITNDLIKVSDMIVKSEVFCKATLNAIEKGLLS